MNDATILMIRAKTAELKRARAEKANSVRTMSIDAGKEFQARNDQCEKLVSDLLEIVDKDAARNAAREFMLH